jgi:hypothetical protein
MKHLLIASLLIIGCTSEPTPEQLKRKAEIEQAQAEMIKAQKEIDRIDSLEKELLNRY